MGINFSQDAISLLQSNYGGHPFLTRHACSAIAKLIDKRPVKVDDTLFHRGAIAFSGEGVRYSKAMLKMVQEHYLDEVRAFAGPCPR